MTPRLLRNPPAKTLGVGLCFLMISCGGKESEPGAEAGPEGDKAVEATDSATKKTTQEGPLAGVDLSKYDTELDMVTYAWDPQAGDKSVSAEDGGPGFCAVTKTAAADHSSVAHNL